jgi:hypothetical protein
MKHSTKAKATETAEPSSNYIHKTNNLQIFGKTFDSAFIDLRAFALCKWTEVGCETSTSIHVE